MKRVISKIHQWLPKISVKFYTKAIFISDFPRGVIPNGFKRQLTFWASLVAQWLRVCLPMQGTRVRALVWEDPTCRRATRPVSHNY